MLCSVVLEPAPSVVPASSPIKSVKELIAAGTAKPGSLNYGSVGIGSLEHLWCSNFSKRNRLDAVHVPFKGMPDAATAPAPRFEGPEKPDVDAIKVPTA